MPLRRFLRRADEFSPDEVRMTLGEHLEELRSRIIRAIIALVLGGILCYVFIDYIEGFFTTALFSVLRSHGLPAEMSYFSVAETFVTDFKLAFIVGFIVTAPYILTQLWGFVGAGLYPHERKWVRRFVPVSIALFFVGAFFFLIVVTPIFLDFFISYRKSLPDLSRWMPGILLPHNEPIHTSSRPAEAWPTSAPASRIPAFAVDPKDPPEGEPWMNQAEHEIRVRFGDKTYATSQLRQVGEENKVQPNIRIGEYMTFVLQMAAAFGVGFQVPVVVALLATIGIATAAQMGAVRKYVWFGICIAAAIITPSPDVTSMMLLFVPMTLLYEAGLLAARIIERERQKKAT
jgi:sec-independent protein translocase protein TatC